MQNVCRFFKCPPDNAINLTFQKPCQIAPQSMCSPTSIVPPTSLCDVIKRALVEIFGDFVETSGAVVEVSGSLVKIFGAFVEISESLEKFGALVKAPMALVEISGALGKTSTCDQRWIQSWTLGGIIQNWTLGGQNWTFRRKVS